MGRQAGAAACTGTHRDAKALHEADGHVDVGLADELVLDADVHALGTRGQRGRHEQRCQVLAAHRAAQLHLCATQPARSGFGYCGDASGANVRLPCSLKVLSHLQEGSRLVNILLLMSHI